MLSPYTLNTWGYDLRLFIEGDQVQGYSVCSWLGMSSWTAVGRRLWLASYDPGDTNQNRAETETERRNNISPHRDEINSSKPGSSMENLLPSYS